MKWEDVYTAVSRMKKLNNIKLLLSNNKWNTLTYIASLEKDPDMTQFFKGYPDTPNTFVRWDPNLAGVGISDHS